MKKIFSILAIAALMAGCSKEDSTTDVAPATFTLTGYTSNDTRTAFGTPDYVNNKIPFVWSEGDKIWSGNQQSNAAVINGDGSASFTFASEPESTIYYNMTGTSATQANVPASQSIANNLGQNGDFGYAIVEDGTFTLSHATAYLWFNTTTSIADATLETVSVNADGVNIAGKATWNGTAFGEVNEAKSEVTLTIDQTLSATNENVWAMVVLPANLSGKSVKVVYKLNVGGNPKYYTQTLAGKDIQAGRTQKISANISESNLTDYRELRVLTFEDNDAKFSEYTLGYASKTIKTWSDLIDETQNLGTLLYNDMTNPAEYYWVDDNNTYIKHMFPTGLYGTAFSSGGYAVSNYTNISIEQLNTVYNEAGGNSYAIYDYQLSIPLSGGHSGQNFIVGYHDSTVQYEESALPSLEFSDGVARVIDHMYVTNTSVTLYSMTYSHFVGHAYEEGDYLNIVATGYNETTKTGEVKFELAKDADKKITEWTKWDLSSLGKVTKIIFRMEENTEGLTYGTWYDTPMYFAFDDVAVQF